MTKLLLIEFLSLVVITIALNVPLSDIPGLDHLKSGFDASKMQSVIDMETVNHGDKTRGAIFDFSEVGMLYELKTIGHTQVFQTPAVVHVTDVSLRTENYCEAVVHSFQEFYEKYFSSTSFDVGVSIRAIEASIGYNRIVDKAYHALKDGKKAVGISGKWWGMYSMQLPPAFLLPYHRHFNLTVQRLQQIGIPTSEAQQTIYNQMVTSYGTHYLTSVVVGGRASLFSLINTSYIQTHSYREVSEQISFNFRFTIANASVGIGFASNTTTISNDFLKNSEAATEFLPPMGSEPGESEWNVWSSKAWQQPVAINRTASPITELLADYPVAQQHLQKTIDYYLRVGKKPMLQELQ